MRIAHHFHQFQNSNSLDMLHDSMLLIGGATLGPGRQATGRVRRSPSAARFQSAAGVHVSARESTVPVKRVKGRAQRFRFIPMSSERRFFLAGDGSHRKVPHL